MVTAPTEGVRALAVPAAEAAGLVLEDVTVSQAGRRRVLRVTVDLPEDQTGGVPMEAVAAVSQALSTALDASDVMGGTPYVLEVSSPGAERPLTEPRHWRRARGRLVQVTLVGGGEVTARLQGVDDDGVLLETGRLAWSQIQRGRVELEFGRPGAAGPEDPTDLDDPADVEDPDDPDGIEDAETSGANRTARVGEA